VAFELIPITESLWVEGQSEGDEVGDYRGKVIAIALRDTDPLSASQPEDAATAATEGLLGWGTTYFLVCDPNRDQPVWVAKESITSQELGDGGD
jgi:hypothetical protein